MSGPVPERWSILKEAQKYISEKWNKKRGYFAGPVCEPLRDMVVLVAREPAVVTVVTTVSSVEFDVEEIAFKANMERSFSNSWLTWLNMAGIAMHLSHLRCHVCEKPATG